MSYWQLLMPRWFAPRRLAFVGRAFGKLLYIPATLAVISFAEFFFKVVRRVPHLLLV